MVKNLPIVCETQVWSLGQEDSLEKGMEIKSSIFFWETPWTVARQTPLSMECSRQGY